MIIYAQVKGLAIDEAGNPAYGYIKLQTESPVSADAIDIPQTVAGLFGYEPGDVIPLTADEYYAATENEEEKRHAHKNNI